MAYAILVKALPGARHAVAWQFHIQLADKTADVSNPAVDLGFAAFWFVAAKFQVKVSTGALDIAMFMSDVTAGTGNINYITPNPTAVTPSAATPWMLPSGVLGTLFMEGWGGRSQEFLNIDITLSAGGATFDADIYATPIV